jgi:hypothetical protein
VSTIPILMTALALAGNPASPKVKLVFSIDQGFGNGIVVNHDMAGMKRIIEGLKTLRPQYDVYALFEPQVKDRAGLDAMLDLCVAADMPFMFDAYSSDAMTLGTSTVQNAPADGPHGIAITVEDLARYQDRYGRHLAGLRFMEIFSQDFTVRAIRTTNPEWKGKDWKMPADDFWQPRFAREFLQFARDRRMFVQWSDWHWQRFAGWDGPQKAREADMRKLLGDFPGVAIVTYANNEPSENSVPRLMNWHEAVAPFVESGAAAFGLSDQSWLRKDDTKCPVEDIVAWAKRALELKCPLIQFEPVWYFFKLPRGSFGLGDYTKDPAWSERGTALPTFARLRQDLLDAAQRPAGGASARSLPAATSRPATGR